MENNNESNTEKSKRVIRKCKTGKNFKREMKDMANKKTNNKKKSNAKKQNNTNKEIRKEEKKINKKEKKARKKHRKLKLFLKLFFLAIIIAIVAAVAAVVAIFKTDKWTIDPEILFTDAGAILYDKNDNEIGRLTGDEINRKISLDEMGKVPEAFLSIEDERFYEHNGIDIKRSAYAIFKYITSGGKGSFGGSTITQQLIKITMSDDARSGLAGIERKIREWSRAVQIEKKLAEGQSKEYAKNRILERYLNRIYLGSNNGLEVRGVEAAAKFYFNKSAKDLSIAQAAFIAGINHSPSSYNPFGESDVSEKVKKRTLTVIEKMYELGKINNDEYNSAKEENNAGLKFEKGNISNGKNDLSYHTAAAINQIANDLAKEKDISYSEARELLINSGYKIYTTVDPSIQDKMEAVYEDPKYILQGSTPTKCDNKSGQSAMVIIDHTNGQVVGMVGALGKDQDTLGINRATSVRQPGSSFKPLATIGPCLENKVITAATLVNEVPTSFGSYHPKGSNKGIINIRTLITHSYNTSEVKLLSLLGLGKSQEFLSKVGIDVDVNKTGLSLTLGSESVSPLQMAAAYAAIANKGEYISPTLYKRVVDQDGKEVIKANQTRTRAMSEENAYIESTILQGPIRSGTASRYNGWLGQMDVAGKTGSSDQNVDRWFCGFTPYYAAACWYGADNGYNYDGNKRKISFGSDNNPACRIWFPVMQSIHKELGVKKFEKPGSIISLRICKVSGKRATDKCTDTYSEIFAKDNTPGECDGHQTVKICKETGKLATEFCKDTEEKIFGIMIDTEKNGSWSPKQQVETAPEETCNVHTTAEEIEVPNVVGQTEARATVLLKNKGFTVKVTKNEDPKKNKGVVLKQSSTKAPKGSEITITVNSYEGKINGNTINSNTVPGNTTGGGSGTKPNTNTVTPGGNTTVNTVSNTTTTTPKK